ncbi:MAG: hypothetical protein ACREOG_19220 [Gemmatimonadaceae bacterium]
MPTTLDGRLLPRATDTFTVSYGAAVIGRGIMHRSISGSRLLQVYSWRSARGDSSLDSLFSDLRTLRSIREVRVVTDTVIEVTYANDSITVTTRTRGTPPRRKTGFAATDVFSSAILDGIVASAPLAERYQQSIRFYYAPPAAVGVVAIRISVEGSETDIDKLGRPRDAWRVLAVTPSGGTTFWIDKATRSMLQFDTREGAATIQFRR